MIFALGISSQNKPCLFMNFSPLIESQKNLNWKGPLNLSWFNTLSTSRHAIERKWYTGFNLVSTYYTVLSLNIYAYPILGFLGHIFMAFMGLKIPCAFFYA